MVAPSLLPVSNYTPDVRIFIKKIFIVDGNTFSTLKGDVSEVQSGLIRVTGRHVVYGALDPVKYTDDQQILSRLTGVEAVATTKDNNTFVSDGAYEIVFGAKNVSTVVDTVSGNNFSIELELPISFNQIFRKAARMVRITTPMIKAGGEPIAIGDGYDVYQALAPYITSLSPNMNDYINGDMKFAGMAGNDATIDAKLRAAAQQFTHLGNWIPIIDQITRRTIIQPMDRIFVQATKRWAKDNSFHAVDRTIAGDVNSNYVTIFSGVVDKSVVKYGQGVVGVSIIGQGANKWTRRSHWTLSPSVAQAAASTQNSNATATTPSGNSKTADAATNTANQSSKQPSYYSIGFGQLGGTIPFAMLGTSLSSLRASEVVKLMYVGPTGGTYYKDGIPVTEGDVDRVFSTSQEFENGIDRGLWSVYNTDDIKKTRVQAISTLTGRSNRVLWEKMGLGTMPASTVVTENTTPSYTGVGDFILLTDQDDGTASMMQPYVAQNISDNLRSGIGCDVLQSSNIYKKFLLNGAILPRGAVRILSENIYGGWTPYAVCPPTLNITDSQVQSRFEVIKRIADNLQFEYYEDQFGLIWFRPPSYHINPKYDFQIIDIMDIKSEDHSEDDSNIITEVFISGDAHYSGLQVQTGNEMWMFNMNAVWNPGLEERYGVPVLHQLSVPGFGQFRDLGKQSVTMAGQGSSTQDTLRSKFDDARRAIGYGYMQRENRKIFSSELTLTLRPEIVAGTTVVISDTIADNSEIRTAMFKARANGDLFSEEAIKLIEKKLVGDEWQGMVGYVTRVSHNIPIGQEPTTSISLSYRRPWNKKYDELAEWMFSNQQNTPVSRVAADPVTDMLVNAVVGMTYEEGATSQDQGGVAAPKDEAALPPVATINVSMIFPGIDASAPSVPNPYKNDRAGVVPDVSKLLGTKYLKQLLTSSNQHVRYHINKVVTDSQYNIVIYPYIFNDVAGLRSDNDYWFDFKTAAMASALSAFCGGISFDRDYLLAEYKSFYDSMNSAQFLQEFASKIIYGTNLTCPMTKEIEFNIPGALRPCMSNLKAAKARTQAMVVRTDKSARQKGVVYVGICLDTFTNMRQKLLSVYNSAINAGMDKKKFADILGHANAYAIRNITELIVNRYAAAQNINISVASADTYASPRAVITHTGTNDLTTGLSDTEEARLLEIQNELRAMGYTGPWNDASLKAWARSKRSVSADVVKVYIRQIFGAANVSGRNFAEYAVLMAGEESGYSNTNIRYSPKRQTILVNGKRKKLSPEVSCGIFQVNLISHRKTVAQMWDYKQNIQYAFTLWRQRPNWQDWNYSRDVKLKGKGIYPP